MPEPARPWTGHAAGAVRLGVVFEIGVLGAAPPLLPRSVKMASADAGSKSSRNLAQRLRVNVASRNGIIVRSSPDGSSVDPESA